MVGVCAAEQPRDRAPLSVNIPMRRRCTVGIPREVQPGVYEAAVLIPEHGAYSIHVASKTLKKQYHDLASLSLRTARPDLEAEMKRRMVKAKP